MKVSLVPFLNASSQNYHFEEQWRNIDEQQKINDFYLNYWSCSAGVSCASHKGESDNQDCSFRMTQDQKIRNHQEFLRSEEIERLRLSKNEMYDLLLQPYLHERIIDFLINKIKVKM